MRQLKGVKSAPSEELTPINEFADHWEVSTKTGGRNADVFVFNSLTDKRDIITDFDSANDLIDLRPIFANSQFNGATPFSRFTQFVRVSQAGKNTKVLIDADGSGIGTTFTNLVTLKNFSASELSSINFVIS